MNQIAPITPDFLPTTDAELLRACESWEWRMFSGQLYKIMVKSDDGEGFSVPFVPNRAQRRNPP